VIWAKRRWTRRKLPPAGLEQLRHHGRSRSGLRQAASRQEGGPPSTTQGFDRVRRKRACSARSARLRSAGILGYRLGRSLVSGIVALPWIASLGALGESPGWRWSRPGHSAGSVGVPPTQLQ
jgi:hypothetical protein